MHSIDGDCNDEYFDMFVSSFMQVLQCPPRFKSQKETSVWKSGISLCPCLICHKQQEEQETI